MFQLRYRGQRHSSITKCGDNTHLPHLENDMEKEPIHFNFRLGGTITESGIRYISIECGVSSAIWVDEISVATRRNIPKVQALKHLRTLIDIKIQEMEI